MFFWQEWDIVTILQLLATWPAGAARLYVSVRGVAAAGRAVETSVCRGATVKLSRWNNIQRSVLNSVSSQIREPDFSLHLHCAAFCKRARPKYNKANYRNSFLSFEMTMPRKMFGDVTTECSIFAATAPALSICSNYWKKRVCSSLAVCKNLLRSRFELILTDLSVWFLITHGTDVTARVTFFSVARRPFAVGDERATSKCDLTSCKATGHLPCIFIEWSGWGQLAVLRGNTINYTPRCSGWERLTAWRSNWKRNIRNGGKHKLWWRREKGEEEK